MKPAATFCFLFFSLELTQVIANLTQFSKIEIEPLEDINIEAFPPSAPNGGG